MIKWLLGFVLYTHPNLLQAQPSLTILVKNLPHYHSIDEPLYIAGSFNKWNPGQKEFLLKKDIKGDYFIRFELPKGKHEFKITKGSWENVESGNEGFPTENRLVEISNDTAIEISIQHWADHFLKKPKISTANKQVKIIESAFFIPQLNRYRRIWIYLPFSYATSGKKYPVLYMHDGQNVFDDSTSFSGEWGVDETLDTLETKTK